MTLHRALTEAGLYAGFCSFQRQDEHQVPVRPAGTVFVKYDGCEQRLSEAYSVEAPPPALVANAIEHALFAEKPREHYLVVADPFEAQITIGKLIEELVHMNDDHDATFDRDTLIKMLDTEEAVYRGERPRRMPGEHWKRAEKAAPTVRSRRPDGRRSRSLGCGQDNRRGI